MNFVIIGNGLKLANTGMVKGLMHGLGKNPCYGFCVRLVDAFLCEQYYVDSVNTTFTEPSVSVGLVMSNPYDCLVTTILVGDSVI